MKKQLMIVGIIVILLIVGLSGCTNEDTTSNNEDEWHLTSANSFRLDGKNDSHVVYISSQYRSWKIQWTVISGNYLQITIYQNSLINNSKEVFESIFVHVIGERIYQPINTPALEFKLETAGVVHLNFLYKD